MYNKVQIHDVESIAYNTDYFQFSSLRNQVTVCQHPGTDLTMIYHVIFLDDVCRRSDSLCAT